MDTWLINSSGIVLNGFYLFSGEESSELGSSLSGVYNPISIQTTTGYILIQLQDTNWIFRIFSTPGAYAGRIVQFSYGGSKQIPYPSEELQVGERFQTWIDNHINEVTLYVLAEDMENTTFAYLGSDERYVQAFDGTPVEGFPIHQLRIPVEGVRHMALLSQDGRFGVVTLDQRGNIINQYGISDPRNWIIRKASPINMPEILEAPVTLQRLTPVAIAEEELRPGVRLSDYDPSRISQVYIVNGSPYLSLMDTYINLSSDELIPSLPDGDVLTLHFDSNRETVLYFCGPLSKIAEVVSGQVELRSGAETPLIPVTEVYHLAGSGALYRELRSRRENRVSDNGLVGMSIPVSQNFDIPLRVIQELTGGDLMPIRRDLVKLINKLYSLNQ
jgi:hypothetical protein